MPLFFWCGGTEGSARYPSTFQYVLYICKILDVAGGRQRAAGRSYPPQHRQDFIFDGIPSQLAQTARWADIWRNAPRQGLVSHVATREEAATIRDAMTRDAMKWVERRRRMEQQMHGWQNAEHHAWQELKNQAEAVNTLTAKDYVTWSVEKAQAPGVREL